MKIENQTLNFSLKKNRLDKHTEVYLRLTKIEIYYILIESITLRASGDAVHFEYCRTKYISAKKNEVILQVFYEFCAIAFSANNKFNNQNVYLIKTYT